MATALNRSPAATSDNSAELNHLYCCDPDTALCGTDIGNQPELHDDGETTCIVCAALEEVPCRLCGAA